MDVFEIFRIVLRRWNVVMPMLAITLLAAVFVAFNTQPAYEGIATVLVKAPIGFGSGEDTTTGAGSMTPSIIRTIALSDDVRARLERDAGIKADYSITADDDGIMTVKARATERDIVVPTVEAVLAEMRGIVQRRSERSGQQASLDVLADATRERAVEGEFVASASAVLDTPQAPLDNPFLSLDYSTRVLVAAMQADAVRDDIIEPGSGATFEVAQEPRDPAPLLFITVTGPSNDVVLGTLDNAITAMTEILDEQQGESASAEGGFRVTIDTLSKPEAATLESTNLLRPLVLIIGLGLLSAVSLAVLVDSRARPGDRQWHLAGRNGDHRSPAGAADDPLPMYGTRRRGVVTRLPPQPQRRSDTPR
jgi:hypothetical protein